MVTLAMRNCMTLQAKRVFVSKDRSMKPGT
jgi:hypothetical protein